jgi:hypothetical protein
VGFFELIFGFTALIVLVPMISKHWYKLRVKQWEMSLKHTMLERGMSADDIKSVLEASAAGVENKAGCPNHHQHA